MRRLTILWLAIAALFAVPSHAGERDRLVSIDIFISNDYDESNESLDDLTRLLDLGFVEVARPAAGQSLDDYVFDRYDFGPSQLPRTFALIEERIRAANRGRRDSQPYYIPAIPRRRSTKLNAANPYYDVARLAEFDVVKSADGLLVAQQRGATLQDSNRGSKYTLLRFIMPAAAWESVPDAVKARADRLIRSIGQTAVADRPMSYAAPPESSNPPPPEVMAAAMTTVRPSTQTTVTQTTVLNYVLSAAPVTGTASPAPPLTETAATPALMPVAMDTAAIAEVPPPVSGTPIAAASAFRSWPPPLTGLTPRRTTYLFIIDDGWPTAAEADVSVAFVERQINAIRAQLQLPAIHVGRPAAIHPAEHSSEIAEAIADVTAQDSGGLVKVVYVPILLLPEAAPLQRELLHLREVLSLLPANPWRLTTVPPATDTKALARADRTLADWQSDVDEMKKANDRDWVLRAETLNTIYDIGEYVARSSGTVFVVNQSWSVRGGMYKIDPTDHSLTVAAAGNDGVDVVKSRLDFASRARNDEKYLAVMFADRDGVLQCGSAKFDEADVPQAYVVSFDGVLPNRKCGTSYAAPRIAWGVAARISNAATAPGDRWRADVQKALQDMRGDGKPYTTIFIDDVSRLWR